MLRAAALISLVGGIAAQSCSNGPTLFFSQFQEASSGNNKYYQIYNPTSSVINLGGGYALASCANGCASDGVFEYIQTFASGATIGAGGTYTVCNSGLGSTTGCDEVLSYPGVSFNGNDFQALINQNTLTGATAANIVDAIGLFTAANPGSYWPVCGTSSGMDTRNGLLIRATSTACGDASGSAFDGTTPATCPWTEVADTTSVSTWPASAGGAPPSPASPPIPLMTIYQISYDASHTATSCAPSAFVSNVVRTRGYVSAVDTDGFYMQEYTTASPFTGMFVYTTSSGSGLFGRDVGQYVEVVGTVVEYYSLTEISTVVSVTVISTGHTLTPVVTTTGTLGTSCNIAGEAYEGSLVTLRNVTIVSTPTQYGEITIDDGSGPTQLENDLLNTVVHFADQYPVGSVIFEITGVIRFAYGSFEIHPRIAADIVFVAPSPPAPPGTGYHMRVTTDMTVAGDVDTFDIPAFRVSLLGYLMSNYAGVSDVSVAVAAGSVVLNVAIFTTTVTAAVGVETALISTTPAEMSSTWFGGTTTVEAVTTPTATLMIVASPSPPPTSPPLPPGTSQSPSPSPPPPSPPTPFPPGTVVVNLNDDATSSDVTNPAPLDPSTGAALTGEGGGDSGSVVPLSIGIGIFVLISVVAGLVAVRERSKRLAKPPTMALAAPTPVAVHVTSAAEVELGNNNPDPETKI